jgi:hypothetical protein
LSGSGSGPQSGADLLAAIRQRKETLLEEVVAVAEEGGGAGGGIRRDEDDDEEEEEDEEIEVLKLKFLILKCFLLFFFKSLISTFF